MSLSISVSYKTILILGWIVIQSVFIGTGENSQKLDTWERLGSVVAAITVVFPVAVLVFPVVVSLLFRAAQPIILWIPITALITVTLDYGSGATYWFINTESRGLDDATLLKNTVIHHVLLYLSIYILHRNFIFDNLANVKPEERRIVPTTHDVDRGDQALDKLLSRMPRQKWGAILEISVDGRSSKIRTTNGTHLVRIPLKDAAREVDVSKGFQVHRSIWLNEHELEKLFFEDGNPRVLLVDGSTRPVSRSKTDRIREVLRFG